MGSDQPALWSIGLRGTDASALADLRRWVASFLPHLERDRLHDVLLVADELAANAYQHAGGPQHLRMAVHPGGAGLTVEVDDPSPVWPVVRAPATQGRGLRLVGLLAERWGCQLDAGRGGKTVWARVPLGRAPGHRGAADA
jgi:two-component sensor histidine kinase